MHIPDGFIDLPTSAFFAAASAGAITYSLVGARKQLDEKSAPLAGLTAVFIFAVQMLNFPVAAGTSGHLLGGALAAVLVGPYAATLALTVVLVMQGFLFADGGLSAIGLNVLNMAVLGVWNGAVVNAVVFHSRLQSSSISRIERTSKPLKNQVSRMPARKKCWTERLKEILLTLLTTCRPAF